MIIRKASTEDVDSLVHLRIDFLNEVNGREEPPEGYAVNLERYFFDSLTEGSFVAWIVEDGGRIVATSGMCIHSTAPNYSNPSGESAYILNMYTVPEWRGRGLASSLFSRLIEEARERGCGKATLHATKAGRKVYEKFGFHQTDDEMSLRL